MQGETRQSRGLATGDQARGSGAEEWGEGAGGGRVGGSDGASPSSSPPPSVPPTLSFMILKQPSSLGWSSQEASHLGNKTVSFTSPSAAERPPSPLYTHSPMDSHVHPQSRTAFPVAHTCMPAREHVHTTHSCADGECVIDGPPIQASKHCPVLSCPGQLLSHRV